MPKASTKTYQPEDRSFKNGAYIVTPYKWEVKVGKTGRKGLYLTFIIVASMEPGGDSAVGRTILKWIDNYSARGANELIFIAKTIGLDVEGDTEDEDFINAIFTSEDPNAVYYLRAMINEVERPGTGGNVFTSLEIPSSRKTGEPMLTALSKTEQLLIPDDEKITEIFAKADKAQAEREARSKAKSYGGGGAAPAKPKYDDGFGSGSTSQGGYSEDADIPF